MEARRAFHILARGQVLAQGGQRLFDDSSALVLYGKRVTNVGALFGSWRDRNLKSTDHSPIHLNTDDSPMDFNHEPLFWNSADNSP